MAKFLTDRHEIAKAMNFGKYPVLYIDMENRPCADIAPESDYARGCRCRVHWDSTDARYKDMYSTGTLYHENGRFAISGDATCLKADFGRSDVIAMYNQANTPMIHRGDTVVVVEDRPSQKICKVRMMKADDRINRFCSTICYLNDIEEEE